MRHNKGGGLWYPDSADGLSAVIQFSWFSSTWMYVPRSRYEVFVMSPQFSFKGVLGHSQAQMSLSLASETFHLTAITFLWWFQPLTFPLAMFIFLLSSLLVPNCPGLSDAVLPGGFCISTHNAMICDLKVMISSPSQPLPIWPRFLLQVCPHAQIQPYGLKSWAEVTWPLGHHINAISNLITVFKAPWRRQSLKCL